MWVVFRTSWSDASWFPMYTCLFFHHRWCFIAKVFNNAVLSIAATPSIWWISHILWHNSTRHTKLMTSTTMSSNYGGNDYIKTTSTNLCNTIWCSRARCGMTCGLLEREGEGRKEENMRGLVERVGCLELSFPSPHMKATTTIGLVPHLNNIHSLFQIIISLILH